MGKNIYENAGTFGIVAVPDSFMIEPYIN